MSWLSNVWDSAKSAVSSIGDNIKSNGFLNSVLGAVGTGLSAFGGPIGKGVGGFISSLSGDFAANAQDDKDKAYAAEQAQLNRDFQVNERIASQDYNSPANQMRLLAEAGINPNAIAQNGNSFVPTKASSGSMASSSGGLASSLLLADAQIANLLSSTRKTEAEAEHQEIQNQYAPRLLDNEVKKGIEEIGKISAERGFTDEQTRQAKELFPLLKGKSENEIKEIKERTNQIIENIAKTKKETANLGTQGEILTAEKYLAQWRKDFVETWGISPDAGLIDGLIQSLASDKGSEIGKALITTVTDLAISLLVNSGKEALNLPKKVYNEIVNKN